MPIDYSYRTSIYKILDEFEDDIDSFCNPPRQHDHDDGNLVNKDSVSEAVELAKLQGNIVTYLNWLNGYFAMTEMLQSMNLSESEIENNQIIYIEKNPLSLIYTDGRMAPGFNITWENIVEIFQNIEDVKILKLVRNMVDEEIEITYKNSNYHYTVTNTIEKALENVFFKEKLNIPEDYLIKNKKFNYMKNMNSNSEIEDLQLLVPFVPEMLEADKNKIFKSMLYHARYYQEDKKASTFTKILSYCQLAEFTPKEDALQLLQDVLTKDRVGRDKYMTQEEITLFFQANDTNNKIKASFREKQLDNLNDEQEHIFNNQPQFKM